MKGIDLYRIDRTDYGVKVTAGGVNPAEEIACYLVDIKKMADSITGRFCIYYDLRSISPFDEKGKAQARKSNDFIKAYNVIRTVSVTSNPAAKTQLQQLTYESSLEDRKRYIDASSNPDWELDALGWILHGIDPEKKATTDSMPII